MRRFPVLEKFNIYNTDFLKYLKKWEGRNWLTITLEEPKERADLSNSTTNILLSWNTTSWPTKSLKNLLIPYSQTIIFTKRFGKSTLSLITSGENQRLRNSKSR
jgi:hypothetical protein